MAVPCHSPERGWVGSKHPGTELPALGPPLPSVPSCILHTCTFLHSHVDVFALLHGHTPVTASTCARLASARLQGWARQRRAACVPVYHGDVASC